MADISKCIGVGCNLKRSCYRFTAPSGMWQSWNPFHSHSLKTHENKDQHCNDFLSQDRNYSRQAYYCDQCKGITYSTVCENPSCPNQPCCGEPGHICKCNK